MAVQGLNHRLQRLNTGSVAFGVTALAAAALSLAAALAGLHAGSRDATTVSAVDEVAARNERIAFFEQRVAADPIDLIGLNSLAFEYLQRARESGDVGDYARAELAAERSLAVLPSDNLKGLLASASVRLVQHDFAGALTLAGRALVLKPRDAGAIGIRSDALVGLGRYDDAERDLQTMVEIEPALPALSRLAGVAFLKNDLLNAEDFWKQAIARPEALPRENVAWAQVQLGRLYLARGDLKRAEEQFQRARRTFPGYVHADAGIAAVRAAQERWQEAIDLYAGVQERRPEAAYMAALADVYERAGRAQDAANERELIEGVDRIYRASGISTDLQSSLFYSDHDMHPAAALQMAQSAYDSAPGVYSADALAWALYSSGRFAEASTVSKEALRYETPEASFYFHAGLIEAALGHNGAAIDRLETALRLNPYFSVRQAPEAKTELDLLKGAR